MTGGAESADLAALAEKVYEAAASGSVAGSRSARIAIIKAALESLAAENARLKAVLAGRIAGGAR